MSDVVLNCAGCDEGDAARIPSGRTTGFVDCVRCGEGIDVAHAFAHAPWCVACGEDLSECACDTPDRVAVSDALIALDRIVAGLSAPVREGSAEDIDPDGFRSMLSESLAEIHDRIARALGLGDPS